MPEVIVAGKRINLIARDVLGAGGEGTVFRAQIGGNKPFAIKLYHDPSLRRQDKLLALKNLSLPPEVIAPLELAWDLKNRQVIGFAMRLLPAGQEPFEMLMKPDFRDKTVFNNHNLMDLFLKLYEILGKIHETGMVIGDENSYNLLFKLPEIALIDADSYQFGIFPCEVATERFLSPRLYGVDLSKKPVFVPMDDWYSYLVLLFSSLLLVHPYGGAHRQIQSLTKRALVHLPVFDVSVKYPSAAYPLQSVSDDLMQIFDNTFAKGQIQIPEKGVLESYRHDLAGCPKCDFWYPRRLKNCPLCSALNQKAMRAKVVVSGLVLNELFETQGQLVFVKVIGRTIFAVTFEQNQAVLYLKESMAKVKRIVLFPATRGARYDIFDHYLVCCLDLYAENPILDVYDFSRNPVVRVTSTVTERFGSEGAVFRGTVKYLYRQVGGLILRGFIPLGRDLVEQVIATVVENQSWFAASSTGDQEILCGFFRTFAQYDWYVLINGQMKRISVESLRAGETLMDRSVRFSGSSILVLRQTREKGEEYIRLDLVNLADLNVFSRRVKVSENPLLSNIHNLAFGRGIFLLAQAGGIMAENVQTGGQRTFPQTQNIVDEKSYLWPFENGVLAITGRKFFKLVIK